MQSDLGAKARPAADDHASNVVASCVARDNSIRDEECGRTGMITNDAIRREVRIHLIFAMTGERTQTRPANR